MTIATLVYLYVKEGKKMPTHGPGYSEVTKFENMIGATLTSIEGKVGDEQMMFVSNDGRRFVFWYEHDCCASCTVEDICGDLADLVGSPLVEAEEVSNIHQPPPEHADSYTWTFYRFATAKGAVVIRWLGESNGYYSESVSYREETVRKPPVGDEVGNTAPVSQPPPPEDDAPQPTLSRSEIANIARDLEQRSRETATPRMSEPEFAAWYQAYIMASAVFAMDPRMSTRDKGRLAEEQANEAVLVWRGKRMREGMAV